MKILVIGDLHGRKPRIHYKNFDAVIFVGDVCDDRKIEPLKDEWVRELEKRPNDPPSMDAFIVSKIGTKRMKQYDKESLKVGRKILECLNSLGRPIFMVGGNWDQSYGRTRISDMDKNDYNYYKAFLDFWLGNKINSKLIKGLKNIKDCQLQLHKFNGVNIFGYGLSSNKEKPRVRKKRKYTKKEMIKLKRAYKRIIDRLESAYRLRDKELPNIFITHNVPYDTPLDIINVKDSKFNGMHFGSTVARDFVNKYQPMLCIGGHIHEHFKKCKIKKTVAINAGYGRDANILIDLDEKKHKIKSIKFWGGMKG